ncbi:S-type pyocin domain-containing protein [Pseudomonas putida ND6]|uniref:S-type pyocin domain-containing protein n=1 Tax=Pseudomonas putida ND6 TaxID=231023 RepID=I3UNG3_PSEPU|nr:S-type pyocin domain-containing protein [Pseudomonas putida ND6]
MDWREARITAGGVELVKLQTSRLLPSGANKMMIDRLEKIYSAHYKQPTSTSDFSYMK